VGRHAIDEATLQSAPACALERGRDERWNLPLFVQPSFLTGCLPLFVAMAYWQGSVLDESLRVSLSVPNRALGASESGPPQALLLASPAAVGEVCAWLHGASRVELRGFELCANAQLSQTLAAYIVRATAEGSPPSMFEMDARGYVVLIDLLRCANVSVLEAPQSSGLTARDQEKVKRVIESSLATPIRVGDLAASVGLSEGHFARAFKASFGDSPAAYILRRRAETARRLVEGTPMALAEVAQQSGFSSQAHMTARLRTIYGHTPRALRLSAKSAGASNED
jgi:AraC-like DNA-binding protein